MFKKLTLAAGALIAAATLTPTAASAQGYSQGGGYYQPVQHRYRPGDYYRGGGRYYNRRGLPRRGYARGYPRRGYYGRGYCRDSGAGGTILGAIAGGLLGAEIADGGRYHRGDEAAGAIIGAGVGALAGRAIDRDC